MFLEDTRSSPTVTPVMTLQGWKWHLRLIINYGGGAHREGVTKCPVSCRDRAATAPPQLPAVSSPLPSSPATGSDIGPGHMAGVPSSRPEAGRPAWAELGQSTGSVQLGLLHPLGASGRRPHLALIRATRGRQRSPVTGEGPKQETQILPGCCRSDPNQAERKHPHLTPDKDGRPCTNPSTGLGVRALPGDPSPTGRPPPQRMDVPKPLPPSPQTPGLL